MLRKTLLVLLLWVVLPVLCAEGLLRLLLFRVDAVEGLRRPGLYASYYWDEEYWKLRLRFEPRGPSWKSHPLLGWFTRGNMLSLRHAAADRVADRRPVLLYGDSFAGCFGLDECFEDRLNASRPFGERCYLLNYAVSGYGLDQIYLLMDRTVDLYEDPLVVFSVTTIDLARSTLALRERPKPWFELDDGELRLAGVPVETDPRAFVAENPVGITSYLYRLALHNRFVPRDWREALTGVAEERRREERLARALLRAAIGSLREREVDFQFLVYGSRKELAAPPGAPERRRLDLVTGILESEGVPSVSVPELVRGELSAKGGTAFDYFLRDNGHPNARTFELARAALERRLRPCVEGAARPGGPRTAGTARRGP